MNVTKILRLMTLVCLLPVGKLSAAPHTPPAGSDERKSICDAVRARVVSHAIRRLPQAIVFKVDSLRVDEGFAWFEGTPRFADGSSISTDFLPEVDYVMLVQRTGSGWVIREDLSGSDMPSNAEAAQLRARFAPVPASILPDAWRRILKK